MYSGCTALLGTPHREQVRFDALEATIVTQWSLPLKPIGKIQAEASDKGINSATQICLSDLNLCSLALGFHYWRKEILEIHDEGSRSGVAYRHSITTTGVRFPILCPDLIPVLVRDTIN